MIPLLGNVQTPEQFALDSKIAPDQMVDSSPNCQVAIITPFKQGAEPLPVKQFEISDYKEQTDNIFNHQG